jgi:hypothetical protein
VIGVHVTTRGSAVEPTVDRAAAHRARLAPYVEPHLARRRAGDKHPVHDFLFTYYSFSPAKLLDWQPGWPESGSAELLERRGDLVRSTFDLLQATAARPATFGCFGLHEWAMVYRRGADDVRHADWPLRLGSHGTDEVVESASIRCTHYDAYRFFTPESLGRNALRPTRATQVALEQPGCLHANMDLYKWAYKLGPLGSGELLLDCFELARDVRELDMRASPYDLAALGYQPVKIETTEGKAEYVAAQRGFTARAAPLRERLLEVCRRMR